MTEPLTLSDPVLAGNVNWFSQVADVYDKFRPAPPEAMFASIRGYNSVEHLGLVVDLGCGTGISSVYWASHADEVVGVEPNGQMLDQAVKQRSPKKVRYVQAVGNKTGLPDQCADIVSCFQSLHWMPPGPTFEEVYRLLKPGGLFIAADYDWPPSTGSSRIETAWEVCVTRTRAQIAALQLKRSLREWNKLGHLSRMQLSGHFVFARQILCHHVDEGSAERILGCLHTQADVAAMIKKGISEHDLGIDLLRDAAVAHYGVSSSPLYWSCRACVGIKSKG